MWNLYCHLLGDMQVGLCLGLLLAFVFPGKEA